MCFKTANHIQAHRTGLFHFVMLCVVLMKMSYKLFISQKGFLETFSK